MILPPEYLNNQSESSSHQFQILDCLKMHIFLGYFFFIGIVFVMAFFLYKSYLKLQNCTKCCATETHIFSK